MSVGGDGDDEGTMMMMVGMMTETKIMMMTMMIKPFDMIYLTFLSA